ncbi:MAG: CDGSH iron-sulfur domain-containing protein [Bacteroidales bacterium]|nr:CDGSH iron-sulfur domain-containing protein [Bacteroidales bacterium]
MTEIRRKDTGPIRVKGNFKLIGIDGKIIETADEISLCGCGKSENKPFCDGTHKKA